MAALQSRCSHYILQLWFLLSFFLSSFFARLFSAVADWMSTMLPHNDVALVRIWNGGLKCVASVSLDNRPTGCKTSPKIRHLHTIAQLCRAVSSQLKPWFHVKIKLFKEFLCFILHGTTSKIILKNFSR